MPQFVTTRVACDALLVAGFTVTTQNLFMVDVMTTEIALNPGDEDRIRLNHADHLTLKRSVVYVHPDGRKAMVNLGSLDQRATPDLVKMAGLSP